MKIVIKKNEILNEKKDRKNEIRKERKKTRIKRKLQDG